MPKRSQDSSAELNDAKNYAKTMKKTTCNSENLDEVRMAFRKEGLLDSRIH